MELSEKVILITGASSGIGEMLARQFHQKGAKLILIARREDKLKNLAQSLSPEDPTVLVAPADITYRGQLEFALNKGLEHFGHLDIVINNAGLGYFGPFAEISVEEFDRILKTNIYGILHMTQLAFPHLKRSKGMVVNISSALSKRALPFLTVYAGTKSMVDALSDGMRLEFRKYGVKVLNYCPPEVETEFAENSLKGGNLDHRSTPRKKAKPGEVAARIIGAIEQEKREVVEGRFLQIMNFLAPKLVDKMFYKGMVLRLSKD